MKIVDGCLHLITDDGYITMIKAVNQLICLEDPGPYELSMRKWLDTKNKKLNINNGSQSARNTWFLEHQ